MSRALPILLCILSAGCGRSASSAPNNSNLPQQQERFYELGHIAKDAFNAGKFEVAKQSADELLSMAPSYPRDWNYGNAIQDGNLVLGRLALKAGRLDEAKQRLLAAGNSPGSPQMDSFGPNMSLANDLLDKGERDVVLEYFDLCRKFWALGQPKLDEWTADVKSGTRPNFGANLLY